MTPDSAIRLREGESRDDDTHPIDADHSQMVKFSQNNRNDYAKVCKVLRDYIDSAGTAVKRRFDQDRELCELQSVF